MKRQEELSRCMKLLLKVSLSFFLDTEKHRLPRGGGKGCSRSGYMNVFQRVSFTVNSTDSPEEAGRAVSFHRAAAERLPACFRHGTVNSTDIPEETGSPPCVCARIRTYAR